MADYKVTDSELTSVANAIRTKGGTQAQLEWPTGFSNAVAAIPSGSATLIEKSITQNGTYNASSDNADGYSKVIVNVSGGSVFPHGEFESVYSQSSFNGLPLETEFMEDAS